MSALPLDPARASCAHRPGLRAPRGGVSWVTLLLLVVVVGGGYLAWVWGPVYFERYAVKQVVRDYMNQAIKNRDDQQLRHNMVLKIRSLSKIEGVDEWGQPALVPAVQLDEQDVVWERDTSTQPPILRVSFEYTRDVEYPFLDRIGTAIFAVDLSNDLVIPDWGPAR